MNASDLFRAVSPALAAQIFTYLVENDKPTFRVAIQTLAAQRKLRPVFVERKPRDERFAWLHHALSRPASAAVGANLIQMWLMGGNSPMLCDFLDSLGIAHDEKGGIEDLPPSPPADQVQAAVEGLLAKYPPENVAVYLHCFQAMEIAGWPALAEMLESDARLRLEPKAP